MTDREMLFLAYGGIKASSASSSNLRDIVKVLEDHLWADRVAADAAAKFESGRLKYSASDEDVRLCSSDDDDDKDTE